MTTEAQTLALELTRANPQTLADALRQVDLGNMLKLKSATITQSSSATVVLPEAALMIQSLQVTTGTATGFRFIGDAAATPSTTIASLATDGKTITLEAAVTVTHVMYVPAPATALSSVFAPKPV